jgi:hypothetical protein
MNYYGIEITPEEALFILKLKIDILRLHRSDTLPQMRKWIKMKISQRELQLLKAIVDNERSDLSQLIRTILIFD